METMTSTGNPSPSNVKTNLHSENRMSLGKHLHSLVFILPIVALAVIYFQLRVLPAETLGHLGIGLIVVAGALAGLGTFLWCIHWGVSRDGKPERNTDPQPDSDEHAKERTYQIPVSRSNALADHSGLVARREVANSKAGVIKL